VTITFTVLGLPQPQGSKTTGRTRSGQPYLRESNRHLQPWRQAIAAAALEAMNGQPPLTRPLRLNTIFVFPRPKHHYSSGRNAEQLKPSAPAYQTTRPDLDKLTRAIGDALTGIVYRDDAQLAIIQAEKHYGTPACTHLTVEELTDA
jgi:Holliday junction resolvase RusA-like endonuclease